MVGNDDVDEDNETDDADEDRDDQGKFKVDIDGVASL